MQSALSARDRESGLVTSSCGGCRLADHCAESLEARGPLEGASLILASLLYFLPPAILALVGAAVAGPDAFLQLIGALSGLTVGLLIASAAALRYRAALAARNCHEPR